MLGGLSRNFSLMTLFDQNEKSHITDCPRVIHHDISWLFQAFTGGVNTPSD